MRKAILSILLSGAWLHAGLASDGLTSELTGDAGSERLSSDLNSEIDIRIAAAGSLPGALNIFSAADDEKFVYKRNKKCWVADLDLTGASVSHTTYNGNTLTCGGALITPQDLLCANHFFISGSVVLNFVDAHNVVHKATVTGGAGIPGTDLYVCHLATALPPSIKFYKILPANYLDYSPAHNLDFFPILMAYNFGHLAYVFDSYSSEPIRLGAAGVTGKECWYYSAFEPSRAPFTTKIGSGSGSPVFLVIRGEPVLIGCLHTTHTTSWIADSAAAVNQALVKLGSKYQLTTVDLSAFQTY